MSLAIAKAIWFILSVLAWLYASSSEILSFYKTRIQGYSIYLEDLHNEISSLSYRVLQKRNPAKKPSFITAYFNIDDIYKFILVPTRFVTYRNHYDEILFALKLRFLYKTASKVGFLEYGLVCFLVL